MENMFSDIDGAFGLFGMAFMGFWQFGFFLGGAVFFLIGLAIIYDFFRWRGDDKAYVTHGDIIGVRVSGLQDNQDNEEEESAIEERLKEASKEYGRENSSKNPAANFFGTVIGGFFVLLILAVPVVFFGFGAYKTYDYYDLKSNGKATTGIVVDYKSYHDSDSGTTYNAIIAYHDQYGQAWREEDHIGGSKKSFSRGQQLNILYDPQKPERFIVDLYWHNMLLPFIFMGIALVFMFFMFGGGNMLADRFRSSREYTSAPQKRERPNYAGEMYHEVIEYVTKDGQRVQAMTNSGSSSLRSKVPGMRVNIIANEDKPLEIRRRTTLWLWLSLLIFILPSSLCLFLAFHDGVSPFFFVIIAFFAVTKGGKLLKIWADYKALPPEEKAKKKEQFAISRITKQDEKFNKPLLGKYDVQDRLRYYAAQARISALILFVLAGASLTAAYFMGYEFFEELYNNPQEIFAIEWSKLREDDIGGIIFGGFGLFLSAICLQSYFASRTKRF